MRLLSSAAALGSLGVLLTLVAASPTFGTTPFRPLGGRVVRPTRVIARPALSLDRRQELSGCTSNYGTSGQFFVGETGGDTNFAGGQYSAVTGGHFNQACGDTSGIHAGNSNVITATGPYAFIGAGAQNIVTGGAAAVVAGYGNVASGGDAFVGGGTYGAVPGSDAFLGGGGFAYSEDSPHPQQTPGNIVAGSDSFVGAGDLNQIAASGNGSFIGAGDYAYSAGGASIAGNQISGSDSFIGTGDQNTVAGNASFVGAGTNNTVASTASDAMIGSGARNSASGQYAVILGGFGNGATGSYAVVAGGDANTAAGTLSLAGGYHADAAHNGSFVWSDYTSGSAVLKDTAVNQFVVRASGGTFLYSNEAGTIGVELAPGSGTWASLSDRNAKTDIVPLDDAAVLAKVAALPVSAWRYASERGARHVGPMAQDFYAAFGVGSDDRHIASIDEDGIALSAIKALDARQGAAAQAIAALNLKVARKDARIDRLQARLTTLENRLDSIVRKPAR
jgi:trimeric autotransporter adhesin